MTFVHIDGPQQHELLSLPETGMGFQIVEATYWGIRKQFLVLGARLALDLSKLDLDVTSDPAALQRNEARIIEEMKTSQIIEFAAPGPHSFRLVGTRVAMSGYTTPSVAVRPSSLVKHVTLTVEREFYRFSASLPDPRVNPTTGDVAAGTYACPASEVPSVPTGFVAVGRFALPNNLPASYRHTIRAPVGTLVSFGTVTPAFGQAGGGVEALFPNAVINQSPYAPPLAIPDE